MMSMSLPSKRLIGSYVLDWIIIIVLAAIGGAFKFVPSTNRPFSLLDLTISFPFVPESISVTTLFLVALVAPAVLIALTVLLFLPAKHHRQTLSTAQLWRLRLWEVYTGITGLALSIVLAFFSTQGLKTIYAKPRPHFLAICNPDLSAISQHTVGGFGQPLSDRWSLVNASICSNPKAASLLDGFRSFPSGHCSFSWAGLLYLSLFFCAKFSIVIPYLPLSSPTTTTNTVTRTPSHDTELLPLHQREESSRSKSPSPRPQDTTAAESATTIASLAAAPPIWGVLLALIPIAVAAYIASTRYAEFWHFGFDVIAGSSIGIVSAWLGFRWYHLPITRGQGWAWGARGKERAFAIGVGRGGWVE